MNEKELKQLYQKYVEGKYFYRVFSKEYLPKIKKEGFNPKINPYESQKSNILKFCKILERLEQKGYNYVYLHWPRSKPVGSMIARVIRKSMKKKYLDLTPNDFNDLKYYQARKGGDIPLTIFHVSQDLIKWKYPLTNDELEVIKGLQKWCEKRMSYDNITIKMDAKSNSLEKAELQRFLGKKYLPSPFGSFKNFSKNINKFGFELYKPYLSGKEQYYIRFRHKIPAKEILFI